LKLNGWQRIWVILAASWLLFVIFRLLDWMIVQGHTLDNKDWGAVILALIAPFGVYIFVLLARRLALWIIEGFRGA